MTPAGFSLDTDLVSPDRAWVAPERPENTVGELPERGGTLERQDPAHTIPDPVGAIAAERLGIPYLFPYQRIVVANILDRAARGRPTEPTIESDHDGAYGYDTADRGLDASPLRNGNEHDPPRTQLVLLPTGAGKSLCFQLPALLLPGITVVVFPLLSLIEDQRRRLEELGIPGVVLRGGQTRADRERALQACRDGSARVVLSNPETILTEPILRELERLEVSHLVIDEAHCVSEWGETFRPRYLDLHLLCSRIPGAAITAFTATASPIIRAGIVRHLFSGDEPQLVQGVPDRPNIHYRVLPTLSTRRGLVELLRPAGAESLERPALVFCPTRRLSEETARYLRAALNEREVYFYHAGLAREEKIDREKWFFSSSDGILCATTAYGMGVDKANIRSVVHLEPSPSVESYLQESGRAGRDGKPSTAVLLSPPGGSARRGSCDRSALEQERAQVMAGYLTTASCRRSYLLAALGAEVEYCNGCDRCDEATTDTSCSAAPHPKREEVRLVTADLPSELVTLLSFFAVHRASLNRKAALATLCGANDLTARKNHAAERTGFGLLGHWDEIEVAEALRALERSGMVHTSRRGLYRGRLRLTRFGKRTLHTLRQNAPRRLRFSPAQ